MLREFLIHVIHSLENYIKGIVHSVHFSAPVKQKRKFRRLFQEILPEYVGFVFAPKSKRYVTPAQVAELRGALSKKISAVENESSVP